MTNKIEQAKTALERLASLTDGEWVLIAHIIQERCLADPVLAAQRDRLSKRLGNIATTEPEPEPEQAEWLELRVNIYASFNRTVEPLLYKGLAEAFGGELITQGLRISRLSSEKSLMPPAGDDDD